MNISIKSALSWDQTNLQHRFRTKKIICNLKLCNSMAPVREANDEFLRKWVLKLEGLWEISRKKVTPAYDNYNSERRKQNSNHQKQLRDLL